MQDEKSNFCADSTRQTYLFYPRDIATLRSAYEKQAIFSSSKQASNTNTSVTTLRGDLSEPTNGKHDTVRSYGGQLTPLAQESVLLSIVEVIKERKIQFVVLRSTNSLDQIFLSQFLRRLAPDVRIVIDGTDLLFRRGAEGASLRGVMALSTYPLLTWQQDWTFDIPVGKQGSYRIFGEDDAEGLYIAARGLFQDQVLNASIRTVGHLCSSGLGAITFKRRGRQTAGYVADRDRSPRILAGGGAHLPHDPRGQGQGLSHLPGIGYSSFTAR